MTMLAEFGDKTQLAIVVLSARYNRLAVFSGSLLAFAIVDGATVLVGEAVAAVLPLDLICAASGLVFIVLGVYSLAFLDSGEVSVRGGKFAAFSSFLTISMMELGDKTQLAIVTLAARYGHVLEILSGVMLAFLLLTAVALSVGRVVSERIPERYLRVASAVLFILFGVLSLTGLVMDIDLF